MAFSIDLPLFLEVLHRSPSKNPRNRSAESPVLGVAMAGSGFQSSAWPYPVENRNVEVFIAPRPIFALEIIHPIKSINFQLVLCQLGLSLMRFRCLSLASPAAIQDRLALKTPTMESL